MKKRLLKYMLGTALAFGAMSNYGIVAMAEDVQEIAVDVDVQADGDTTEELSSINESVDEEIQESVKDSVDEVSEEPTEVVTEDSTEETTEDAGDEVPETDDNIIGENTADGWQKSRDYDGNVIWKYYKNNVTLKGGPHTIDGKVYFFNNSGVLQTNTIKIANGYIYQIGGDGVAKIKNLENGLFNNTYYVVNGKLVYGWKKIGSNWYYFQPDNGEKVIGFYSIDDEKYYFDTTGRLKTGWFSLYGKYYWSDSDGVIARSKWCTIQGAKYYFDYYGVMQTGVARADNQYCEFTSDGQYIRKVTVRDDWYKSGDNWYCFDAYGNMMTGVNKVSGKWYYFDYDTGVMLKNTIWGGRYYGSTGAAVTNCWKELGLNSWKYYGADSSEVAGWKKISNKWYYFDPNYDNYMVIGDWKIDGIVYHFGEDGVWDGKTEAQTDGWYQMNGEWHYRKDGKDVKGYTEIGSDNYYFDSNGVMLRGMVIHIGGLRSIVIKSSGKVKKTDGWYTYDGHDYVYVKNGYAVMGLQKIDGKQYYFYSWGLLSYTSVMDAPYQNYYEIDAKTGAITKTYTASGTKWVKLSNGDYLYSEDGTFVRGRHVIGGKEYFFDSNGILCTNYYNGEGRYYGESGTYEKSYGWVKSKSEWMYIVNGKYYRGPVVIDGTHYLFTSTGVLKSGIAVVDGNIYEYSINGGRKKLSFKNGWNQYNNKWYYVVNDTLVKGTIKIGKNVYHFDDNYEMVTSAIAPLYSGSEGGSNAIYIYLDEDGKLVKNYWKKDTNGDWYYFGADGICVTGEHVIEGKKYVFSEYGVLLK